MLVSSMRCRASMERGVPYLSPYRPLDGGHSPTWQVTTLSGMPLMRKGVEAVRCNMKERSHVLLLLNININHNRILSQFKQEYKFFFHRGDCTVV